MGEKAKSPSPIRPLAHSPVRDSYAVEGILSHSGVVVKFFLLRFNFLLQSMKKRVYFVSKNEPEDDSLVLSAAARATAEEK
jgi:hypothetical protein